MVWYGAPKEVSDTTDVHASADPSTVLAKFPEHFWFGLATAPAHIEEEYPNDPWMDFADKGKVAAVSGPIAGPHMRQRLRFWTEPEIEIDMAANTGASVFRMGVEWGRLSANASGVTNQ